jgi:hypothetical protein
VIHVGRVAIVERNRRPSGWNIISAAAFMGSRFNRETVP